MRVLVGISCVLLGASVAAASKSSQTITTQLTGCPSSSKPRFCVDSNDVNCCDLRDPDMSSSFCQCQGDYTNGNLGKDYSEGDIVPFRVTAVNGRNSNVFLGADRSNQKNQLACYAGADTDNGWAEQCNSGRCGYSSLAGVTLNAALSTTDCVIKVGKPLCDTRPDKKSTMWVQVVQVTGQRCVLDYYARVAIGGSRFPGSSLHAYFAYGSAQTIPMSPSVGIGASVSTSLTVTRKQAAKWTVARTTDISDVYMAVCLTPTLVVKNNITYWPSGFEPIGDPVAAVNVQATAPSSMHNGRLRYEIHKITPQGPVTVFARDVAQAELDDGQFSKSESVPLLGHADGSQFRLVATYKFADKIGMVQSTTEGPVTGGSVISSLVTIKDTAIVAAGLTPDFTDKSQRTDNTLEFAMSTAGSYAYTFSMKMPDLDINEFLDNYVQFDTTLTGYMTASSSSSKVHYYAEHGGCSTPCRFGDWSEWGACQCDGTTGTSKRTRSVTRAAIGNGGCDLTKLQESQQCITCPVACQWGAATCGSCTPTNGSCGVGTRSCTRAIASEAVNGGAACTGPSVLTETCRISCPCVSSWSEWGSCSATCLGGNQFREAIVTQYPDNGACGPSPPMESRTCDAGPCPVNGQWTAWTSPSTCSATCGGGQSTSIRTCTSPSPAHGGVECACTTGTCAKNSNDVLVNTLTTSCNTQQCVPDAINCEVSSWSPYGACSKTCDNGMSGPGVRTRTRSITVQPANGGAPCPPLSESQPCGTEPCPYPCTYGAPMDVDGVCEGVCGTGQKRVIEVAFQGYPEDPTGCIDKITWKSCTMQKLCPCTTFNAWSEWSACNGTCGAGFTTRTRTPTTSCDTATAETKQTLACTAECPVACVLTPWSEWGACSKSCGASPGQRTRSRSVTEPAKFGGVCSGALVESEPCNGGVSCPPERVQCEVSKWTPFTECSVTCGTGQRTRSRTITNEAIMTYCEMPLTETIACTTPCPVPCQWEWAEWSECSAECAPGGNHTRKAVLIQQATAGGSCDYPGTQPVTEPCNTDAVCKVDCVMGLWSDWLGTSVAACSPDNSGCVSSQQCRSLCDPDLLCGPNGVSLNNYLRDRVVSVTPANGGLVCGAVQEVCECPCTEEVTKKNPPYMAIGAGVAASAAAVLAGAGLLYMWMQSRKAAEAVAQFEADTLLVNGNEVNPLYQANTMNVNNPIFDGQA